MIWWILRHMRFIAEPILEAGFRAKDYAMLFLLWVARKKTVREILFPENICSSRILIFATYPVDKLESYHVRFIERFEALGYAVVLVTNHKYAKQILKPLLGRKWCFIFRRPFGRDFGCYKDASLLVYELRRMNIDRVVFVNDSVITFPVGEDRLVEHLTNPRLSYAGLTENFEFYHHIGSFMVAISGAAFCSKPVMTFFKKYIPISTRKYSIHRGEFGLTRALSRSGCIPSVLYDVGEFKRYLESLSLEALNTICLEMPRAYLRKFPSILISMDEGLSEILALDKVGLSKSTGTLLKRLRGTVSTYDKDTQSALISGMVGDSILQEEYDHVKLQMVRYRARFLDVTEERQKLLIEQSIKKRVIDSLVEFIFKASQIHQATPILLYMGAGVIKKDVVYRALTEPHSIVNLLYASKACATLDEAKDVASAILAKGHPYSLRGRKKLLYDWGFI